MSPNATASLFVLDDDAEFVQPFADAGARVVRLEQVIDTFRGADARSRWVAPGLDAVAPLLTTPEALRQVHGLLVVGPAPIAEPLLVEALHRYFRRIIEPTPSLSLLGPAGLAAVLATEHPEDYVIGAQVVRDVGVILVRGLLDTLVVPIGAFAPSPTGVAPDFSRVAVIDDGQAIAFGEYEATVDAILYERDAEYRRRAKARELAADHSFGAALRRLRLLRGLKQSDFAPLDEREIRRLERNEIEVPRRETRRVLARRLGVAFEEISSY